MIGYHSSKEHLLVNRMCRVFMKIFKRLSQHAATNYFNHCHLNVAIASHCTSSTRSHRQNNLFRQKNVLTTKRFILKLFVEASRYNFAERKKTIVKQLHIMWSVVQMRTQERYTNKEINITILPHSYQDIKEEVQSKHAISCLWIRITHSPLTNKHLF